MLAAFTFQSLSWRLAVSTGRDLATVIADEFPKDVALLLWLLAEISIVIADIQGIIAIAIAIKMLAFLAPFICVFIYFSHILSLKQTYTRTHTQTHNKLP